MRLRGRAMNDGLLAHLSIQSVLVIIVSRCLISLVILTRIFILGANAYCQYESENMIVFSHGRGPGSIPRGPINEHRLYYLFDRLSKAIEC